MERRKRGCTKRKKSKKSKEKWETMCFELEACLLLRRDAARARGPLTAGTRRGREKATWGLERNRWSVLVERGKYILKNRSFQKHNSKKRYPLLSKTNLFRQTEKQSWCAAPTRAAPPSWSARCSSRPRSSLRGEEAPSSSRPSRCPRSPAREGSRLPLLRLRAQQSRPTTPLGPRPCSRRIRAGPALSPWRRMPRSPPRLPLLLLLLLVSSV